MIPAPRFLKVQPDNLTPLTRTPWAGRAIASIKRCALPSYSWPDAIGESWEVSTDALFPSRVLVGEGQWIPLETILKDHARSILGPRFAAEFGASCPILLKWIEASSALSVQVHPHHDHPLLSENECGKPEAWLVLAAQPGARLYLGFRDGVTRADVEREAHGDRLPQLLHQIEVRPLDYIYIPAGCVHALGPGVLVAEPQLALPGKSGKTWRLNDWNRRYDASGRESPEGRPRELHVDAALSAIDWSLPTGEALERHLMNRLGEAGSTEAHLANPFRTQVFTAPGNWRLGTPPEPLFRLVTVWGGSVTLKTPRADSTLTLVAGESAIIAADTHTVELQLESQGHPEPGAAVFELDPEANLWRS